VWLPPAAGKTPLRSASPARAAAGAAHLLATPARAPPARPPRDSPDTVRAFLSAASRGYHHAAAHPEEAADALLAYTDARVASGTWPPLPAPLDADMVRESACALAPYLLGPKGWGHMEMER
jgi:hypothetical protein